jgi:SNF2 family DNA or RNA helicase
MSGRITIEKLDDSPLWAICSSYFSPALVTNAKAVPGMHFAKHIGGLANAWVGHADAAAAAIARLGVKGIRVFGAEALPEPESWRTARTPFLFSTEKLREYQVEGVRFCIMRSGEGALLADAMRLGKSLQSLVAARAFKQHTLVCCPPHLTGVWARPTGSVEGPGEIAKWWPDAFKPSGKGDGDRSGVSVLESVKPAAASKVLESLSKKKDLSPDEGRRLQAAWAEIDARALSLSDANVIVCHYDILYAWADVLLKWGVQTLILDEAHLIVGWASRRSDALKTIRKAATRCIGLTGTPVTSNPRKLHNLLDIVSPGRFGWFFLNDKIELDGTRTPKPSYARVFCATREEEVGHGESQKLVYKHDGRLNLDAPDGTWAITKEETLHHRLKYFMLRRLKKDVDPQLPQTQRQIIDVAVPAKAMIDVDEGMLRGDGKSFRKCLDLAADAKLKSVVEVVADHLAEGEKCICYCYRRAFAETVVERVRLKADPDDFVDFVHGGLSQKDRDRTAHKLRTHNFPGVLVCTIDSYSTGIDLSFASVLVFGELTWEPHELAQAEQRLYAYGKDAKALIQYIIARGTGDELILRAVVDKLDTFERVVGATGDRMREDLDAKGGGLKRLYEALKKMQAAAPEVTKVRKRKG